jgi:DNA polymerase delta subunit 2
MSSQNDSAGKDDATSPLTRNASEYSPLQTFVLPKGTDKHYAQQFADMYFLRLAQLKKAVKAKAQDAWKDFEVCIMAGRRWGLD